jgi:cyclic 2,3-diphosphoglycerate synthetase
LPVVATVLRPSPVESVGGRKVAYFTTAPEQIHERLRHHLEEEHGAEVVSLSGSLSRRGELRSELEAAAGDAEVFLVEIKAAAIDVVAEAASERGLPVVFCDNEVRPLDGEADLDAQIVALADAVSTERVPA